MQGPGCDSQMVPARSAQRIANCDTQATQAAQAAQATEATQHRAQVHRGVFCYGNKGRCLKPPPVCLKERSSALTASW